MAGMGYVPQSQRWNAHRRAQPEPPHDCGLGHLFRQHGRPVPDARVVAAALAALVRRLPPPTGTAPLRSGGAHQAGRATLGDESIKRALAGQFRLVRGSADPESSSGAPAASDLRRLEPYAALQAFRRGELDEAPVPQGEIRALEAHPTLSPLLRARALRGIDVVVLPRGLSPGPAPCLPANGAPWRVPGSDQRARGRACLRATAGRRADGPCRCPRGARLDPRPVAQPADARRGRPAESSSRPPSSRRVAPLGLADSPATGSAQRGHALRPRDPHSLAARCPDDVVPLGWVAEARLVSTASSTGWQMDGLGVVDYSRVSLEAP